MSKEPILRSLDDAHRRVHAVGGLHYLRGNKLPHFSLCMESWVKGRGRLREDAFGAAHDELLKIWPSLKPLADLHLSDIDGVPMHALENGYYWLAGAVGPVFGERVDGGFLGAKYCGGNGSHPTSPDECLEILAKHYRISLDEAAALVDRVKRAHMAAPGGLGSKIAAGKAKLAAWVEDQKPRWKAEADKAIEDLGLVVFGDAWQRSEVAA